VLEYVEVIQDWVDLEAALGSAPIPLKAIARSKVGPTRERRACRLRRRVSTCSTHTRPTVDESSSTTWQALGLGGGRSESRLPGTRLCTCRANRRTRSRTAYLTSSASATARQRRIDGARSDRDTAPWVLLGHLQATVRDLNAEVRGLEVPSVQPVRGPQGVLRLWTHPDARCGPDDDAPIGRHIDVLIERHA
jgi:hypothetical protein